MQFLVIVGGLVIAALVGLGLYYFIANVRLGHGADNTKKEG